MKIGDIVVGNNAWLRLQLRIPKIAGVVVLTGPVSSVIHLFTLGENTILMNDYIEKIIMHDEIETLNIGDLVELKPEIRKILTIKGVGIITKETSIRTSDFDPNWVEEAIEAYLVFFPEENYEYTIPKSCLQLFSGSD